MNLGCLSGFGYDWQIVWQIKGVGFGETKKQLSLISVSP
jgi:hypothetical protein